MEKNLHDELSYSLPDFITGELNDERIRKQIEERLLTDAVFREEHDSLKSTMNFLQSTELDTPSEVYFANLQANILSKVQKPEPVEKQSMLEKLLGYWKIVVPALTVCVVIIIYSRNSETPQIPLPENKVPVMNSGDSNSSNHESISKDKVISEESNNQSDSQNNDDETVPALKNRKVISSNSSTVTSDETSNISESLDGATIFGREDETQAQDEYENLSSDDQLDILQSLKDKNF